MTVPAPDLAERYGSPSRTRRPLVIAGTVALALVGLAWLLWVLLFHGRPQVTSEMVGFDIDGQHAAVARFTVVRRDTTVPASCLLRAYAEDHTVVGERSLTPVYGEQQPLSVDVRTERQATSVELVGCTAPGEPRPR